MKGKFNEILVFPSGEFVWRGNKMRCALGRNGVSRDRKEGDGTTPVGVFPIREVFYRADRVGEFECALPARPIGENDGWFGDFGSVCCFDWFRCSLIYGDTDLKINSSYSRLFWDNYYIVGLCGSECRGNISHAPRIYNSFFYAGGVWPESHFYKA